MARLELRFFGSELSETRFEFSLSETPLRAVRGKTSGAYAACGSFPWTSAVQALALLFLRSASKALLAESSDVDLCLSGNHGTPASSLDYAIDKSPQWLIDMFGNDSHGTPTIKRLIRRTNPNRKRPGPVILAVNDFLLPPSSVQILVDEAEVKHLGQIETLYNSILHNWNSSPSIPNTNENATRHR